LLSVVLCGLALGWQPALYRARAALLVGSALDSPNPEPAAVQASAGLALTYADLASRPAILQAVARELQLPQSVEKLAGQVTVQVQPGSQVIEIAAVDVNPRTAQAIANATAEALIRQTPAGKQDVQAEMTFAAQQLDELQREIASLEARLHELESPAPWRPAPDPGAPTEPDAAAIKAALDAQRATYANLLASYVRGTSNVLTIVEPATASLPVGRPTLAILAAAGLVGLVLGAAGVALSQALDDTLRWRGAAQHSCLGLPVLGTIGNVSPAEEPLFYPRAASSPEGQAVRDLVANLWLADPRGEARALLVTSPSRQDGKSFVAANLGAALAAAGADVVLVDASPAQGRLHEILQVKNEVGLAEALRDRGSKPEALLRRIVRPTGQEHLSVVTAGREPPESPLAMVALRLEKVVQLLKKRFQFVIIDGPAPEGLTPDAGVLAALADQVVLVVKSGSTRESEARECKRAIARVPGANLIGLVFNRAQLDGGRAAQSTAYRPPCTAYRPPCTAYRPPLVQEKQPAVEGQAAVAAQARPAPKGRKAQANDQAPAAIEQPQQAARTERKHPKAPAPAAAEAVVAKPRGESARPRAAQVVKERAGRKR
jgi:capsular exopolysaccharide synthesis family protein